MLTTNKPIVARRLQTAYMAASMSEEETQVGAFLRTLDGPEITAWNYEAEDGIHHAEQSAIETARELGVPTYGATMFAPWHCCGACADLIVGAGIRKVYGHLSARLAGDRLTPAWTTAVEIGLERLKAGGVESIWYVGPIAARTITFKGTRFDPLTDPWQ